MASTTERCLTCQRPDASAAKSCRAAPRRPGLAAHLLGRFRCARHGGRTGTCSGVHRRGSHADMARLQHLGNGTHVPIEGADTRLDQLSLPRGGAAARRSTALGSRLIMTTLPGGSPEFQHNGCDQTRPVDQEPTSRRRCPGPGRTRLTPRRGLLPRPRSRCAVRGQPQRGDLGRERPVLDARASRSRSAHLRGQATPIDM
jgi:hypothetical protein